MAEDEFVVVKECKPYKVKPKSLQTGIKMVTALVAVIEDEPRYFDPFLSWNN